MKAPVNLSIESNSSVVRSNRTTENSSSRRAGAFGAELSGGVEGHADKRRGYLPGEEAQSSNAAMAAPGQNGVPNSRYQARPAQLSDKPEPQSDAANFNKGGDATCAQTATTSTTRLNTGASSAAPTSDPLDAASFWAGPQRAVNTGK